MSKTDGPKRIRALDRGLEVIEHLSNFGLSTLAELRRKTGLSNATLIRILSTLQDRGWVRRNIVEGQYELAHSLENILGANVRAHPLAEIAAPILINMPTFKRGLPSDLTAIIEIGKLEIVESTRTRGPMAPARTGLGIRPSMVRSAHGQAVLAFLSDEDRNLHVTAAKKTEGREARKWFEGSALNKALAGYDGTLIFVSHDREFVSSLATRVIEIKDKTVIDYQGTYNEYLASKKLTA